MQTIVWSSGRYFMLSEIEAFISWLQMRSPQAKTWRDYRCDLALFVNVVGDQDVGEIHPPEIDQFVKVQIDRVEAPPPWNKHKRL